MSEHDPDLYQQVVDFVDDSFGVKANPHFVRTVYWMEQLRPDLPLAFKVAAYSHDIQRAFLREGEASTNFKSFTDETFLTIHQNRGAEIMREFLEGKGVDEDFIKTVEHLIQCHEWGGDVDQDLMMHADSISFFETNAETFVVHKVKTEGIAKIRAKLDWMYNRMNNPQWQQHATADYQKWSARLSEIEQGS